MIQLILHLIGDYVTQSDWMAQNKTKRFAPAFWHAWIYSLPFLLIGSPRAVYVIFLTHFLIDRYRLARFVVYAKNIVLGLWLKRIPSHFQTCYFDEHFVAHLREHGDDERLWSWKNCSATGYPSQTPPWLAVWLMIACDNTIHLAVNAAALAWL